MLAADGAGLPCGLVGAEVDSAYAGESAARKGGNMHYKDGWSAPGTEHAAPLGCDERRHGIWGM